MRHLSVYTHGHTVPPSCRGETPRSSRLTAGPKDCLPLEEHMHANWKHYMTSLGNLGEIGEQT